MAKTKDGGTDFKASLGKLEDTLETYLVDKAPFQLPDGAREFIVKYGPWFALVMLILSLPMLLLAFGLGALVARLLYWAESRQELASVLR